ncbi:MAG: hypothetical protein IJR69_12455 [Bacteroidaceae bacterium]|nr:hypothetical protein [Bacteroidaceae bacterium]
MKKTFKNILLALLGVFALTCCEDVPAPYEIPNKEEKKPDQIILPSGDGTLENPYNVAGVLAFISTLQPDVESDKPVYVKGKVLVNKTDEATIIEHGNMSFTMIDEGNSSNTFLAWQVMAPGNKRFTSVNDIKKGDEVIVYGKVVNYKGNTPETVNRGQAYVYSINGQGDSGGDDPQASTKENPLTVAQAKTTNGNNYVKGYIVGWVDGASIASGSKFDVPPSPETEVLLADSPNETDPANTLPIQLPAGDVTNAAELHAHPELLKKEVTFYGSLERYFGTQGMKGTSWVKIGDKAYGIDPETGEQEGGGEQGGEEGGEQGESIEVTCAKAVELIMAMDNGAISKETYTLTGYITEVVGRVDKNQQSFWMADTQDGGHVFYAFWTNLPEGVSQFVAGTKIKLTGQLQKYVKNGEVTPEMKNGNVVILEEGDQGGDQGGGDQGGDQGGDSAYSIDLSYTGGTNFYDNGVATINGVADCPVLKIGTSKAAGDFTLTVPAGKHSFYAVTWKGTGTADVILKKGEEVIKTITVKENDGANQNSPYTLTVTDADKYEFEVATACTVTVTSDKRIIFFGIK